MRMYFILADGLIIKMKSTLSRRSFIKKTLGTALAAAGIGAGGRYYIHDVEPNWLDITTLSIPHSLIPRGFDGMRIVQFSDTHLGFQFQLKQMEAIVSKINHLSPDLLLFTGDLMDEPNKYTHTKKIAPLLKQLKAPLGKFCVYGNHDHGGYGSEIYKQTMEESGFTLLQNENKKISLLSGEAIYLSGIDDAMLGTPDFQSALADIPQKAFTILMSHAPDLADEAAGYNSIQLQLSGHSHGGQVQVPFWGALVKPPFAEKYPEGKYDIQNLFLYVNRGLGTTRLPYRFLSRPEVTVFNLKAENY